MCVTFCHGSCIYNVHLSVILHIVMYVACVLFISDYDLFINPSTVAQYYITILDTSNSFKFNLTQLCIVKAIELR